MTAAVLNKNFELSFDYLSSNLHWKIELSEDLNIALLSEEKDKLVTENWKDL